MAALLVVALLVVALTTGSRPVRHPRPVRPATAAPPRVAIGLTEANADLLWSPAEPGIAPAFAPWRAALTALRPAYLRLVLDWAALQPAAGRPPRLDAPVDGCLRGIPPCGAYAGLRDELRAIASQQRTVGGFVPVIVIDGAPSWAARPPGGCERAGTTALSRPIAPSALGAYRALIGAILALGRQVGVALPYLSPWNEPNHPYFVSPQRGALLGALALALGGRVCPARPGHGGGAGGRWRGTPHDAGRARRYTTSGMHDTSIGEFVADLPDDVVCLGGIWSVHAYARRGAAAARRRPGGRARGRPGRGAGRAVGGPGCG